MGGGKFQRNVALNANKLSPYYFRAKGTSGLLLQLASSSVNVFLQTLLGNWRKATEFSPSLIPI